MIYLKLNIESYILKQDILVILKLGMPKLFYSHKIQTVMNPKPVVSVDDDYFDILD